MFLVEIRYFSKFLLLNKYYDNILHPLSILVEYCTLLPLGM